jgi:hypothetical protein
MEKYTNHRKAYYGNKHTITGLVAISTGIGLNWHWVFGVDWFHYIFTKIMSSNPVYGEVYSIQHYVIKFVSDLRQVGGFYTQCQFKPIQEDIVCLMVFNATFNNISVISWQSDLLVEVTRENHRPVASHWQTLSHNVVSSTPRHKRGSNS